MAALLAEAQQLGILPKPDASTVAESIFQSALRKDTEDYRGRLLHALASFAVNPEWLPDLVDLFREGGAHVKMSALAAIQRLFIPTPGALIRSTKADRCPGFVVRWPRDRADWEPSENGSDEWVVVWLPKNGDFVEELACASSFTVVGYFPETP